MILFDSGRKLGILFDIRNIWHTINFSIKNTRKYLVDRKLNHTFAYPLNKGTFPKVSFALLSELNNSKCRRVLFMCAVKIKTI